MSEEVVEETNSEESTGTAVVTKKPAKKAPAKKPAAKKAVKKAAKAPAKAPKDNARLVAKASEGKLKTDQVRILRALKKGKPVTMQEIKAGVGLAPDAKYSSAFLKAVHNLTETRRVKVEEGQEKRAFTYTITERGKSDLEKAESAAKAK